MSPLIERHHQCMGRTCACMQEGALKMRCVVSTQTTSVDVTARMLVTAFANGKVVWIRSHG